MSVFEEVMQDLRELWVWCLLAFPKRQETLLMYNFKNRFDSFIKGVIEDKCFEKHVLKL